MSCALTRRRTCVIGKAIYAANSCLNRRNTCVDYFLIYYRRCTVAESLSSGPTDTASKSALVAIGLLLAAVCQDAFEECSHVLKGGSDVRVESTLRSIANSLIEAFAP